jgi:hypothetical protein
MGSLGSKNERALGAPEQKGLQQRKKSGWIQGNGETFHEAEEYTETSRCTMNSELPNFLSQKSRI